LSDTFAAPPARLRGTALGAIFSAVALRRGIAVACTALLVLEKLVAVLLPLIFVKLLAQGAQGAQGELAPSMLLLALFCAAGVAVVCLSEYREVRFLSILQNAQKALVQQALAAFHRKPQAFFAAHASPELTRAVNRAAWSVDAIFSIGFFNILPTVLQVLFACGVLWVHLSALHAALLLLMVGLLVSMTYRSVNTQQALYRERIREDNRINAVLADSLVNAETVRAFGGIGFELERLSARQARLDVAWRRQQTQLSAGKCAQASLIQLSQFVLLGATVLASTGTGLGTAELGVGLVMVSMYVAQVFGPLESVGLLYSSFTHAFIDLRELDALTRDAPPAAEAKAAADAPEAPEAPEVPAPAPLQAQCVSVAVDGKTLLDAVSLRLPARGKIALVGPTGSGKTTLARALTGMGPLSAGRLLLNDVPATPETMLRHALYVSQTTGLFDDTLEYNIGYGNREVQAAQLGAAVERAQLASMLKEREAGLASPCGELGARLSGGERQRIAVARALLNARPVMVFDEITAQLDAVTETAIFAALDRLAQDALVVHVTHHLEMVADAERIFCFAGGRLAEQGTHDELMRNRGGYAALWDARMQALGVRPLLGKAA
jgi:ABC-type multidrug transport system fused ATPase/permease subunit